MDNKIKTVVQVKEVFKGEFSGVFAFETSYYCKGESATQGSQEDYKAENEYWSGSPRGLTFEKILD